MLASTASPTHWRRADRQRCDVPRLSRLTLTVIGAYAALAALILTTTAWLRDDIRTLGDDIRLLRDELRTEIREDWRAEARAEREAWRAEVRADRAAFESHILRLLEQQGIRGVRLDGDHDRTSSVGE